MGEGGREKYWYRLCKTQYTHDKGDSEMTMPVWGGLRLLAKIFTIP